MEENAAATSQKLNADFAAALRRAIAGQQKGMGNKDGQQNAARNNQRKPANDRPRRNKGEGGSDSTKRTRSRLFRMGGGDQLARKHVEDGGPTAKIQSNIKPVTNWEIGSKAGVPFTRVPYAIPKVDLASLKENLTKQNTPKTWHPLKVGNRLLNLMSTSSKTLVQGGADDPTPVARSGISTGAEPVKLVERETSSKSDEKTISIAKEAREARLQAIREAIGGDYSRFNATEFVFGKGEVANNVAQAVASNDDMAPTHKGFTAKSIQQILKKTEA